MILSDLINYLDQILEPERFQDYAPNGLQVEGRAEVARLVTGVTASQALIDAAVCSNADAILVHHGYFWRGEKAVLNGAKKRRVSELLRHDISLIAYHLPLDVHPVFGNNATLAARLGIQVDGQEGDQRLLWYGHLNNAMSAEGWVEQLSQQLGRQALLLGNAEKRVSRIAWCTGGGQHFFDEAIRLGVDMFLTGEVSEQNYHLAMETETVFVAAGHHATERYGVQALGEHLAMKCQIDVEFIDSPNPV